MAEQKNDNNKQNNKLEILEPLNVTGRMDMPDEVFDAPVKSSEKEENKENELSKKTVVFQKNGIRSVTRIFATMVMDAIRDSSTDESRTVKVRGPAKAIRGRGAAAADKQARRDSFSRLTAVAFAVFVFVIAAAGLIAEDVEFSADENRMLQERPSFSAMDYMEGRLEKKIENYVADQFPARNYWIRIKSAMDMTAGKLEVNGVYKCRDSYLVEEIKRPDPDNLKKTISSLSDFRDRYPELDMYFLLAPNAANILSDKLPWTVKMLDQNKYIDSFYDAVGELGYTTIDVRDAFEDAKKERQLYYRTDHHWTSDGAYIAYRRTAEEMETEDDTEYKSYVVKNDFNGTLYSKSGYTNGKSDEIKLYIPRDPEDYLQSVIYFSDEKEKTTEFYQLDKLNTKDAYAVFGGNNHPMYTIKTPTESARRLLLVKDSYANSVIPFLTRDFREIIVVDPRYYYENVDTLMQAEGVTDVLFLYNGNTFFEDDSLRLMLEEREK